jgi:hypothetical protein
VDLRADLDDVEKILAPTGTRGPTPRSSNAIPTALSRLLLIIYPDFNSWRRTEKRKTKLGPLIPHFPLCHKIVYADPLLCPGISRGDRTGRRVGSVARARRNAESISY